MTDNSRLQILLVENDPDSASLIAKTVEEHFPSVHVHHCATLAQTAEGDLKDVDLALASMNLPDGTGLKLLTTLLGRRSDLPIVLVTGEGVLETAIEAIRRGAYDYIVKTGDYLFAIPLAIEKNLAIWRTKQDNLRLAGQLTRTLAEVRVKNHQLEELVHELEAIATTDPLTGLANRRAFGDALEQSFAECTRYGHDLACIMIDLDRFKQLNDTLGHQRGDEVLQRTARVLEANCRRSDIAGRYGGDEFVLLLPETDEDTAQQVAARIGEKFQDDTAAMCLDQRVSHRLTISMGLATIDLSHPANPQQLIAHADEALYRAKTIDRTCVMVYEPDASRPVDTGRNAAPTLRRASVSAR